MTIHTQRETVTVRKLAGSLGAMVEGLDISADIDDELMNRLRHAYAEHQVLVFPEQRVTPAQHAAFASRWGELAIAAAASSQLADVPAVIAIDGPGLGTDHWHTDLSFLDEPPAGSLLLARVLPDSGGDTMFADQYSAYDMLSERLRDVLDGLRAVHVDTPRVFGELPGQELASVHPVVRTHPETGRRALYVNASYTSHFEGMTSEESEPLLRWLYQHCTQPNLTFRHHWRVGDVVYWDNRCTQHFAVHDYGDATRMMHRVTVTGDRPR